MRRTDRAMDEAFAFEIMDEADHGILCLTKEGAPYGIPLSIVRDGRRLLFHTAKAGKKLGFIDAGAPVWVVFVSRVRVPALYSEQELEEMTRDPARTADLISSVFTTEYASAMAGGTIHEVTDENDKIKALELVCQKYTPDQMQYVPLAVSSGMDRTLVFEIRLEEVSAKRKQFDQDGREMKFGRRE